MAQRKAPSARRRRYSTRNGACAALADRKASAASFSSSGCVAFVQPNPSASASLWPVNSYQRRLR